MDAEKLIEEAEALANAATPGPWELEYSTERRRALSGAEPDAVVSPGVISDACVAVTHHGRYDADARFIARSRTLVPELAAALRETTARAEKQKRQFDEALGDLMDGHAEEIRKRGLSNAVTAETYDACHAALRQTEEERDRERQRADAAEFDATALRAAFKIADHTSLAEEMRKGLTTAYELAKVARERDDLAAANVAANKRIAALEYERDAARAELARLTTPRPIAEAPKDGTWIGAIWEDMDAEDCQRYGPIAVVKWRGTGWEDSDGDGYEPPSHFLPLQVLP